VNLQHLSSPPNPLSEDQLNGEGEQETGKYFLPLLLSVIVGEACLT
jgi:hypothetical protein